MGRGEGVSGAWVGLRPMVGAGSRTEVLELVILACFGRRDWPLPGADDRHFCALEFLKRGQLVTQSVRVSSTSHQAEGIPTWLQLIDESAPLKPCRRETNGRCQLSIVPSASAKRAHFH